MLAVTSSFVPYKLCICSCQTAAIRTPWSLISAARDLRHWAPALFTGLFSVHSSVHGPCSIDAPVKLVRGAFGFHESQARGLPGKAPPTSPVSRHLNAHFTISAPHLVTARMASGSRNNRNSSRRLKQLQSIDPVVRYPQTWLSLDAACAPSMHDRSRDRVEAR